MDVSTWGVKKANLLRWQLGCYAHSDGCTSGLQITVVIDDVWAPRDGWVWLIGQFGHAPDSKSEKRLGLEHDCGIGD